MHHHPLPVSLKVDVTRQTLEVCRGHAVEKSYPISTSKYGLGTEPGSFKTPLGHLSVAEKIGAGAPLGAIFKSRVPTGEISLGGGDDDQILTRILWLKGLDEENSNTYSRYIYIHGTNQEHLIGQAASHGCVRMRNSDMAELFDAIPEGTPVEITV